MDTVPEHTRNVTEQCRVVSCRQCEWKHSPEKLGELQVQSEWMMLMTSPCVAARMDTVPEHTRNVTVWNRYGRWRATSRQLLNDSISWRYRLHVRLTGRKRIHGP